MRKGAVIGFVLIILGIGLFAYYDIFIKSERIAEQYLVEAKLIYERGTKESINNSINIFSKIIAQHPDSHAATEAYFYVGRAYEKLGLNRLAYLKYIYLLKNAKDLSTEEVQDIRARLARLRVLRSQTEEGVDQLLGLLNYSSNRDFRSRVYTELGHTYLKTGDHKKSKRMFDIALTENGSNEDAILGKARAYKHMGKASMAYDLYEYFLRYYGNFSNYTDDVRRSYLRQVYESGRYSFKKGSYWQAISFFNRVIRNFPNNKKAENALYWIGESYFELKRYDSAQSYFSRVLSNGYTHKDEDARIKKGYTYFMAKMFDQAAREFQVYMKQYPGGRHFKDAKKWKEMSTREILYRIQNKDIPKIEDEDIDEKYDTDPDIKEEKGNSGVSGDMSGYIPEDISMENVAEL